MREIKFRGKFNKDSEWKYGFLAKNKNFETGKVYYTIKHSDIESTQVDEKSVGEYTGLKDKNGQEIYEGDFVLQKDESEPIYGWVEWEVDEARFIIHDKTNKEKFQFEYDLGAEELEIQGNIYENPELVR